MTRIGDAGRSAEKRLAKRIGARTTPASGAMDSAKGDMVQGRLLIESKSTTTEIMKLDLDWLAKITQEANAKAKLPALAVNFTTGDGRPRQYGSWLLIRECDLDDILERGR